MIQFVDKLPKNNAPMALEGRALAVMARRARIAAGSKIDVGGQR